MRNTRSIVYIILTFIGSFVFYPEVSQVVLANPLALLAGGGLLLNGISSIGAGNRATRQANKQMNSAINKSNNYANKKQAQYAGDFANMANFNEQLLGLSQDINKERSKTYFDTAEGKGFLSTLGDREREARNGAMNAANLNGLSQEAMLSMLNGVNRNSSDALRSLAGQADSRRFNLRSQFMNSLSQYGQGVNNLFQSKYGIDRDALSSLTGASLAAQNNAMNRQAGNQQMIGQGIGNLINLAGSAGWFGGGAKA